MFYLYIRGYSLFFIIVFQYRRYIKGHASLPINTDDDYERDDLSLVEAPTAKIFIIQ